VSQTFVGLIKLGHGGTRITEQNANAAIVASGAIVDIAQADVTPISSTLRCRSSSNNQSTVHLHRRLRGRFPPLCNIAQQAIDFAPDSEPLVLWICCGRRGDKL
jgi:hypothetical protein